MKTSEDERLRDDGVLSELQNVGADSKGLSPFLAFWRSATTPAGEGLSGKAARTGGGTMVEVSPAPRVRRVGRRKSIIERLFNILETLAISPPLGVDPVPAQASGFLDGIAPNRTGRNFGGASY